MSAQPWAVVSGPRSAGRPGLAAATVLADEQFGIVSRRQLLALGWTDEGIDSRLRSGRWQRVHRGTYVVHSGPMSFLTRVSAALVYAGPGAMAAGRTAAALAGLADRSDRGAKADQADRADGPDRGQERIEICLPAQRRVQPEPGLVIRRSRHAAVRRQPARTPARTRIEDTVLDLSEREADLTAVAAWVSRACGRRLTTPARLLEALRQRARHRWRRELTAVLTDVDAGAQSPLELEYLRAVERAHRLPHAIRQQRLAGRTVRWVDVALDEFTTRIELDGRLGHVDEGAFRDRHRDNASTVSGRATLRYGWSDIFGGPCGVAVEVGSVLQARGWTGAPARCGPGCLVPPDRDPG